MFAWLEWPPWSSPFGFVFIGLGGLLPSTCCYIRLPIVVCLPVVAVFVEAAALGLKTQYRAHADGFVGKVGRGHIGVALLAAHMQRQCHNIPRHPVQ